MEAPRGSGASLESTILLLVVVVVVVVVVVLLLVLLISAFASHLDNLLSYRAETKFLGTVSSNCDCLLTHHSL